MRLVKWFWLDVTEFVGEFGLLRLVAVVPLAMVVLVVETFITVEPLRPHFLLGKRHGAVILWAGQVWSVLAGMGLVNATMVGIG